MAMTKKHYEMVAKQICHQVARANGWNGQDAGRDAQLVTSILDDLACKMASDFRATNPLFDTDRFLSACGVR